RERGGWEILRECEAIVALSLQDSLPAGSAHITRAGSLPYKAIIHCVASDASHRSSEAIVERCVRSALAKAEAIACRTLAMPAFATGHAHLKFDRVLEAMLKVLRGADSSLQEVLIVVNDEEQAAEARQLLRS
ncbi:MAG TPA: macro domain-containing protein, partial [Thermoanaerobaculia bacterium]|nr:macro domain-containing protein [Thermoanaerobaculia bacterium]